MLFYNVKIKMKYFYINNSKFNYNLEFTNITLKNMWKISIPLLEYCETQGINVPHYCYHKHLSIAGNCRMCLVELINSPKPIVSCSISAKSCLNNNSIYTHSPLVKKARENIMEFLLLNHPLDCPICDQGGECDLQDQSLFFGFTRKRFYNYKRIVTDKNIGPVVKTVMSRCIHCTRCVRFSKEIAGVEDLGMFGRGLNSEIGTYVEKTFQSELSGNIIDLCPVGALTSKPYPFVNRNWELKILDVIDPFDSFNLDLQIYLKNNKVVKILPNFNNNMPWISDKTRFAFDGMFFQDSELDSKVVNKNMSFFGFLYKKFILNIYFQIHLNQHFIKLLNILIIINNNISLEVLNLLIFLKKKILNVSIKQIESKKNYDLMFENNFLITNNFTKFLLTNTTLALLIGINTRYESPMLNLKLKERLVKGNFRLLNISSLLEFTYPVKYLGLNFNILKTITEGNNTFCQEIITSKNPLILSNINFFQQQHKTNLLFYKLKKILQNFHKKWNNFNVLNPLINDVGLSNYGTIKHLTMQDLNKFSICYFINPYLNINYFKTLLNLKILYFSSVLKNSNLLNANKLVIEQNNLNNIKTSKLKNELKKSYSKSINYFTIPNATFFETTGTYINTEGIVKKNVKSLTTSIQIKEDWQILRRLLTYITHFGYIDTFLNNNSIVYSSNNIFSFLNYIGFQFHALKFLSIFIKNFVYKNKVLLFTNINLKTSYLKKQVKLFNNILITWLNDFYVGGKDLYSQYSLTMTQCSRSLRSEKTNFVYI
jgi:NADH-quinone oxidoreductase chain G